MSDALMFAALGLGGTALTRIDSQLSVQSMIGIKAGNGYPHRDRLPGGPGAQPAPGPPAPPAYGTTNGLVNLPPAAGTNVPFWYCDSPIVGLMILGAWPPSAVPDLSNDSGGVSPSVLKLLSLP